MKQKKKEKEKDEAEEKVTTKSSFRRTCLNLYRTGVGRDVLRQWGICMEKLNDDAYKCMHAIESLAFPRHVGSISITNIESASPVYLFLLSHDIIPPFPSRARHTIV